MSPDNNTFEFDDFLIDLEERVLYRGHEPVAMTPKAFQLLQTLIEKRGKIVEKDELFQSVWGDTNVEEGNLAFTIRLLRKALGDDRSNPRFIETVPRRGYRFIGNVVSSVSQKDLSHQPMPGAPLEYDSSSKKRFPKINMIAIASLGMLMGIIGLATFWLGRQSSGISASPAGHELTALSTGGASFGATISPDGENVVYATQLSDGRQNVWFRQLESGNNVELIPPSRDRYFGFVFSADGNFVYFSRRPENRDGQADILRIPIFGGIPRKIVSEAQGWMSISGDGKLISYVRCPYGDEEFCSLWLADAESGSNERLVFKQPRPFRISANKLSPDGRKLYFATGRSSNWSDEFELRSVDLRTGEQRAVSNEKFFNIRSIATLPDDQGFLFSARRMNSLYYRIWRFDNNGDVHMLTRDATNYVTISTDLTAARIVANTDTADFKLRVFPMKPGGSGEVIASAHTAGFGPEGTIAFSSEISGGTEIWTANLTTGALVQLTSDPSQESCPVFSSDGKYIYFGSSRTGDLQIFRMREDGSEQTRLTQDVGGYPAFTSSDGVYLYYVSADDKTLWRVRVDGSAREENVLKGRSGFFSASALSGRVVYSTALDGPNDLLIASLEDGGNVQTLKNPSPNSHIFGAKWLPNDEGIVYTTSEIEPGRTLLWLQKLDGSPPTMLIELGGETQESFDLAPDGRSFLTTSGTYKKDAVLITGLL